MAALSELLGDLMADVDRLFLFTPSSSHHRQFAKTDVPTVVITSKDAVEAETFVGLPLQSQNVRDRIRFGVEDTMEQGIVEAGDIIACNVGTLGGDLGSLVRVRVEEDIRSGIYDLFANSRADPGVIHDVLEVAIELGKKEQKSELVGTLFIVGDAGKVINESRPLLYNPFEKSHIYVGNPIVNVMLREFSRLGGAFVISDSGKIVSAYRYLEPSAKGADIPKGLGAHHMVGGAITRDTNTAVTVLSESDELVRAFEGGKMILGTDPEAH